MGEITGEEQTKTEEVEHSNEEKRKREKDGDNEIEKSRSWIHVLTMLLKKLFNYDGGEQKLIGNRREMKLILKEISTVRTNRIFGIK